MDVIFEISRTRRFTIEVGFFDTVLEMKEKIQKYEGFPSHRQTLVFHGQVMADERDTEFYEILQGSRIQLIVEPEKSTVKSEESSPANRVQLLIKNPTSKRQFSLVMDITDTVGRLKEKIHEIDGVPLNRFVLFFTGIELQDHRSIENYAIPDNSEINVVIKPLPQSPASATGGTTGSKRLKLMVLPKGGTKKIPVEVNAMDNVGELKKELQRLHQHRHFHLPTEGYFFIYKQNVMDDDRSFRWHDVRQGDTIEIFNGSVTGGS